MNALMLSNLDEGFLSPVSPQLITPEICQPLYTRLEKRNVTISTPFATFYFYFSGNKFSRNDDSVRRVMGLRLVKEIELLQEPLVFLIIILSQPSESFTSSCYPEKTFIISIYRFLGMLSDLQMS